MNYAVIRTGGKQYKVALGDVITVERVTIPSQDTITFSDVLMTAEDGKATFGQPLLTGTIVTGKVLEHIRGEKIRVAKYKAKVRYRRVTGHRQELSQIQIESIGGAKEVADKPAGKAKPIVEKKTRKSSEK